MTIVQKIAIAIYRENKYARNIFVFYETFDFILYKDILWKTRVQRVSLNEKRN